MSVLKYKNKQKLLNSELLMPLKSTERYIFVVLFSTCLILLLFGHILNLRILVSLFLFVTLLLRIKTRSIFISLLLITIFVMPFFNPNKYYTIEVLRRTDILDSIFGYKDDYLLGYGLNISNIFVLLTGFSGLRLIICQNIINGKIKQKLIPIVKFLLPIALLFIVFAIYSTLKYSPFPIPSIVWSLQYFQMFIVAGSVFLYLLAFNKQKTLLFLTILISLLFQSVVGLWQFLRQSSVGISVEYETAKTFIIWALDENKSLFRVSGTFLYHNQLAFIALLNIAILLPYGLVNRKKEYLLGSFMGFVVIVLTQSRIIWIASAIFIYLLFKQYSGQVKTLVIRVIGQKRKVVFIGLLVLFLLIIIIAPRIFLSLNSFYEGAGIPIRVQMISEGLTAFALNPWFGYGVGTNEYILLSFAPNGFMSVFPAAVHQAFLQLALEVGIVGLLLFVMPFFMFFRKILNHGFRRMSNVGFSYIVCCIVAFLYYLFQPHVGIVEFPYLGLLLSLGFYETASYAKN